MSDRIPAEDPAPSIRVATVADAAAIAELTRRAFAQQAALYDDDTLPPLADTAASVTAEIGRGVVILVAEDADGSMVGSVRGEQTDRICRVGRLVVDPAQQERGIGRLLARAVEKRFPRAERFVIFTGHRSAPALRLYESLGYVREREEYVHERLSLVFLGKPGPGSR